MMIEKINLKKKYRSEKIREDNEKKKIENEKKKLEIEKEKIKKEKEKLKNAHLSKRRETRS